MGKKQKKRNLTPRERSKKAPYRSPRSVRVGEVYKGSMHFSCRNEYWMIASLSKGDMVDIKCTKCNKVRTVYLSAIANDFKHKPEKENIDDISPHTLKACCLIGLKSTRSCSVESHKVKDVLARIPIKVNGKPMVVTVDAWYCETCDVYYILHSTYDSIKGIPICDIKDFRTGQYISCSSDYDNIVTSDYETMLHKLGYNVDQRNGLSAQERHDILAQIVAKHQIAKNEIISLLQYYIRRNANNSNMYYAVEKWQNDLEFIRRFRVQNCDTIEVNRIRIK